MKRVVPKWFIRSGFFAATAFLLCLGNGVTQAQPPGGSRQPNRPPPPPKKVVAPKPAQRDLPKGWIVKFTPPKEGANDDLLGVLTFKPGNKDSKLMRFELRKSDAVSVMIGGKKATPEQYPELLLKGLFCTAQWEEVPGDAKKVKQLKTFTLDSVEIEAKVEEVQEGLIVLRAIPRNGDWPDAATQQSSPSKPEQQNKPDAGPKQKKLKLKIVENVSKFTEKNKTTAKEAGDFEVGEPVIANVVYGRSNGMVIDMRPPDEGEARTALGKPQSKKKDDSGE